MLIAEDEEGHYGPVAVVVSISEAREITATDMQHRRKDLEAGGAPMCPYEYKVWARGLDGDYRVAGAIERTRCNRCDRSCWRDGPMAGGWRCSSAPRRIAITRRL